VTRGLSNDRLKRLAQTIDTLIERDEVQARHAAEVAELRRCAAEELHGICAGFVASINLLLVNTKLELDPPVFSPNTYKPSGPNLFQIHVRGRILEIHFEAPERLVSTENFRVPYVLEGAVRGFNQQLLERESVEEQLLFYCLERQRQAWRYFDARTYQSGLFSHEYLVSLMERVL